MSILTGTSNPDTINLTSGVDTVAAGLGADTIKAGAFLTALDAVDGGEDFDTLQLSGNYSAKVIFGANTLTHIEYLNFASGFTYNVKTHDATVAAGQYLYVEVTGGNAGQVKFDGSAETDGAFSVEGTLGNDVMKGGAGNDFFNLRDGGADSVTGGAGDDAVAFGQSLAGDDMFNGGLGYDSVILDGDNPINISLSATTLKSVEEIDFEEKNNAFAQLTTDDGTVAAGETLKVRFFNGGGANQAMAFNGSAETDGRFDLTGGTGNDVLIGGAGNDTISLRWGGNDVVSGGAGDDQIGASVGFTASDFVDGGAGHDLLSLGYLQNNFITFTGEFVKNVEVISFEDGPASRTVVTTDSLVAAGATLNVLGGYLTGQNRIVWNGSAETDGRFTFMDSVGNDILIAGAGDDDFDLRGGGSDNVAAGGGKDLIRAGSGLNTADRFHGGAGEDSLSLDGDYGQPVVFDSLTVRSIELFSLQAGHDYSLVLHDGTIAAGQKLTISGYYLNETDALSVDDRAETNGMLTVSAGLTFKNKDTSIRAGSGSEDRVDLNGDYTAGIVFGAATMTGVETLGLGAGYSYTLETHDGTVEAGAMLEVFGYYVGANQSLVFDGSAETDGNFDIWGGEGNDVLTGGAGQDIFRIYMGGQDVVSGGAGDDVIEARSALVMNADQIDGGAGHDRLDLDANANLTLGSGTVQDIEEIGLRYGHDYKFVSLDSLLGAGETLTVNGYFLAADDAVTFNGTKETNGSFKLTSGAGDDTLVGGAQNDTISAGAGADVLNGFAGDDILEGGAGADTIKGGVGIDRATYLTSTAGVKVSLKDGIASGDAIGDVLTGIENLTGGYYADVLTGTDAANSLRGDGGDDTLRGGGGGDILEGGWGSDTTSYAGSSAGVIVNLSNGINFGGDAAGDILIDMENAIGSSYADTLVGSATSNFIRGGAGKDILDGLAHADRLDGGGGNDTLTGGAHNDTFVFKGTNWGADTVTDWEDDYDKLDLSGNGLTFADLAIAYANGDALISTNHGSILLKSVMSGLTKTDFVF